MKIIAAHSDGITAYQLQSNYHFPRSNVIRYLGQLEESEFLTIEECILDGRANKLYTLSQKGFDYLAELKLKWKKRFAMMDELTSTFITEAEKDHYINKILALSDRKARIDYLNNMKNNIAYKIEDLERKKELLSELNRQISRIVENIENRNEVANSEEIKSLFNMLPSEKGGN